MIILSLDISSKSTGYAVIKNSQVLEFGTFGSSDKDFVKRGNSMSDKIEQVKQRYTISHCVVEELKVLKNQKTLTVLGICQGLILRELKDIPVEFIPPSVWRSAYSLNGKREEAKKRAIHICDERGYTVDNDDEAEAILLGLYYDMKLNSVTNTKRKINIKLNS